jgi:hypothetical protein
VPGALGAVAIEREAEEPVAELGAGTPLASHSFGNTLVAVKPGIVLSSLTSTCPSWTKKSTRARPLQPTRWKVSTARRRTSSRTASGTSAGTRSSIPPSPYLAAKSYQSRPPSSTICPGTEASGASWPITEHSTSMPEENASTITSGSWPNASSSAGPSSASEKTLAMPTEEPSRAGLTKTGVPSAASSWRTTSGSARQRGSRTAA